MIQEDLNKITQTVTGYPVKDLRWKAVDNIIVGRVKCPIMGKEDFNDGFITGTWRANGSPINSIKGKEDLRLKI